MLQFDGFFTFFSYLNFLQGRPTSGHANKVLLRKCDVLFLFCIDFCLGNSHSCHVSLQEKKCLTSSQEGFLFIIGMILFILKVQNPKSLIYVPYIYKRHVVFHRLKINK